MITAAHSWRFAHRMTGFERTGVDLYLYPELELSAAVDDIIDDEPSDDELIAYYVEYVRRNDPTWWETDAVPIYWRLHDASGHGTFETAPFQRHRFSQDFLTHFTWPDDPATGERLDWFQLPVRIDARFPEFAEALRWTPSPFQTTFPLRSFVTSRQGYFA